MSLSKKHYEACLSVDLRCFDNTLPDFGVAGFFEKLGFIPSRIFNHETYMDQIHTHNGVIDDTPLEPQWISQRAVDSAQPWTRRQFKGLIDELHRWDVLFYQGCEAAWSVWPEYGEKSRCTYLYEHLPDIFIVNRDGRTTAQGGMGGINPLRRFRDGTLYEDWMIRDICRFLVDYECDGFFAADGFAGLVIPLENGCYGEDMIAQFTEYTGIEVPPGTTPQRADYIWTHLRGPWAAFYADRWAAFHKKLADAIASIGKRLTAFTPFQMGPADSLYMFGYDYRKSCQAGLHSIALEIMEEVTSRRFQIVQGWESVGIANATTAMAAAGATEILWTMATCNSPEHWNTFRDQPCILEREALALPTLRTVMPDGRRLRTLDGFLTIFGTDLLQEDWRWLTLRTDEGWGYPVLRQHGLTIVWSQSALYHHMHRNGMWPVSSAVCTLRYAGIPVSQAADVSALRHLQPGEWMLLVSPDGLEAQEVRCIEEAVGRGVHLCVMGEVHHPRLLALLGIAEAQDPAGKRTLAGAHGAGRPSRFVRAVRRAGRIQGRKRRSAGGDGRPWRRADRAADGQGAHRLLAPSSPDPPPVRFAQNRGGGQRGAHRGGNAWRQRLPHGPPADAERRHHAPGRAGHRLRARFAKANARHPGGHAGTAGRFPVRSGRGHAAGGKQLQPDVPHVARLPAAPEAGAAAVSSHPAQRARRIHFQQRSQRRLL